MTKKEKILFVGLELFASEGFKGTTASMIAKGANVSEGLIFRHFESKEGLLLEIFKKMNSYRDKSIKEIIEEGSDIDILRKIINFPFDIANKSKILNTCWKFLLKLQMDGSFNANFFRDNKPSNKMGDKLITIFRKLGYQNPEQEKELLLLMQTGIFLYRMMEINKCDGEENLEKLRMYMLEKYNLV